jgi:hypothetical protein
VALRNDIGAGQARVRAATTITLSFGLKRRFGLA